jgi:hypothetical protein
LSTSELPGTGEPEFRRGSPKIFISYRRDDAKYPALMIRDALVAHFGPDSVFMDVFDLAAGKDYVNALQDWIRSCDFVLALIGGRWAQILEERQKLHYLGGDPDQVRIELETALSLPSVTVVPVLLDDTPMPSAQSLSGSLNVLNRLTAASWHWDDDTDAEALIKLIEDPPPRPAPAVRAQARPLDPPATPLQKHLREVVGYLGEGRVIPFLGASVNAAERDRGEWREGCGSLPDSDELASYLAVRSGYQGGSPDLARISQYIHSTQGESDLYQHLRRIFTAYHSPGTVHGLLADLPALLRKNDVEQCHQLIVTMNYDDALEQAFDAAHEEYDLAVYVTTGRGPGKFVHTPWGGEPITVERPNQYLGFPIDVEEQHVHRTIIVKVHGAVSRDSNNCVITENDYIEYLSRTDIVSLVPTQLLNKMRDSHVLFLGQHVRDWNWRVFLQRVWDGRLKATSWAVDPRCDDLEENLWQDYGVREILDMSLDDYVNGLREEFVAQGRSVAE